MWFLFAWIYYECFGNGKELVNPSDDEIRAYLAGNLCRCSGYMSQMRAIKAYLSRGENHE